MRVLDKPFSVDSKYLTLLLCKGARTASKKNLKNFSRKIWKFQINLITLQTLLLKNESRKEKEIFEEI